MNIRKRNYGLHAFTFIVNVSADNNVILYITKFNDRHQSPTTNGSNYIPICEIPNPYLVSGMRVAEEALPAIQFGPGVSRGVGIHVT